MCCRCRRRRRQAHLARAGTARLGLSTRPRGAAAKQDDRPRQTRQVQPAWRAKKQADRQSPTPTQPACCRGARLPADGARPACCYAAIPSFLCALRHVREEQIATLALAVQAPPYSERAAENRSIAVSAPTAPPMILCSGIRWLTYGARRSAPPAQPSPALSLPRSTRRQAPSRDAMGYRSWGPPLRRQGRIRSLSRPVFPSTRFFYCLSRVAVSLSVCIYPHCRRPLLPRPPGLSLSRSLSVPYIHSTSQPTS